MGIKECVLIDIPSIEDIRGTLAVVEGDKNNLFEIKRVYYLYDVPSNASRAGHSHKSLRQIYIAISGSLDISLDDGKDRRTITLNKPNQGLFLAPGVWRDINNFSSNSCLLVLASDHYNESDYIRSYDDFVKEATGN